MISSVKRVLKSLINKRRVYHRKKAIINSNHKKIQYDYDKAFDFRKKGFSYYEGVLYNLRDNNYKEYINTWESYLPRLSQGEYSVISDDKYLFSLVIGKYFETPISFGLIDNGTIEPLDKELANDNLYDFLISKSGGVIKDRCGCDGFNVYVFKVRDGKLYHLNNQIDPSVLGCIVKKFKKGLIQSLLKQGDFENDIFDQSINTIRMITIRKPNTREHEIVCATQRIGSKSSAPVDNFSQGGYSAIINLDTGELSSITSSSSKDKNMNQLFYDRHPDTGYLIKGKIIPHWGEIKRKIIDVTKKLPFFDYIAWDIVLKNDSIAVIEINMKSSLGNIQVHGGARHSKLGEAYKRMGYLVDN